MKRTLVAFIVALAAATVAHATKDQYGTWTEISFTTKLPSPHNEAHVRATIDYQDPEQRLSSLTVRVGEHTIPVPVRAFSDLRLPRLRSLDVLYGSGDASNPEWSFSIRLVYGDADRAFGRPPWADIVFRNGKVVGRWLNRPVAREATEVTFEEF